jgi:hypothetical protein
MSLTAGDVDKGHSPFLPDMSWTHREQSSIAWTWGLMDLLHMQSHRSKRKIKLHSLILLFRVFHSTLKHKKTGYIRADTNETYVLHNELEDHLSSPETYAHTSIHERTTYFSALNMMYASTEE